MKKLLIIFVLTIALGGCFSLDQKFIIANDGTTKIITALIADATIPAIQKSSKDGKPFCTRDPKKEFPGDLQISNRQFSDKGNIVCEIVIEGNTETILAHLKAGDLFAGQKDKKSLTVAVSETAQGHRIDINVSPFLSVKNDAKKRKMMVAMFTDRQFRWEISAPQIVETNGKLSDDKNTASFVVPVIDMIDQTETLNFYVIFKD